MFQGSVGVFLDKNIPRKRSKCFQNMVAAWNGFSHSSASLHTFGHVLNHH